MFESVFRQLPVTALEFASDKVLLTSSGGWLCVYNTVSQKRIGWEPVFSFGVRIHGIHIHQTSTITADRHRALVYGAKSWAIVAVTLDIDNTVANIKVEQLYQTEDWIKAAHWVYESEGTSRLLAALALAHNQVLICDPQDAGAVVYRVQCAERCILYGAAFHGCTVDSLVVASGTVFNQVLVWHVKREEIVHRLIGHEGVVFGVRFSNDGNRIASVSDDRTIVVWDLRAPDGVTRKQLFGHQARIWTCLFQDDLLVSASEDGTCRVWTSEGAVDSWRQCKKNVWSLASSPSNGPTVVASGGADGSIRLWDIRTALARRVEKPELLTTVALPPLHTYIGGGLSPLHTPHRPERALGFALTGRGSEILATESGYILLHRSDGSWATCYASDALNGYSITSCSEDGDLVAVGMRDGTVLISASKDLTNPNTLHVAQLHTSSVQRLIISSVGDNVFDLITTDSSGASVVWSVVAFADGGCVWTVKATFALPRGCRLASAAINRERKWAAIGSINGGLYLFDLFGLSVGDNGCAASEYRRLDPPSDARLLMPCVCWHQAHGKYTLSTVAFANTDCVDDSAVAKDRGRACAVLTGGRDGLVQRFSVRVKAQSTPLEPMVLTEGKTWRASVAQLKAAQTGTLSNNLRVVITRVRSDRLTPGWVEHLKWHHNRLIAVAFHGKRLLAMDLGNGCSPNGELLFSVVCAGGSKQWQMLVTPAGIRIGLIMRSQLKTHEFPLECLASPSTKGGLAAGGCSTETRGVAAIATNDGHFLVATGGDDGSLRLHKHHGSQWQLASESRRHTSAIRCVRSMDAYLLTGGGGCELRCWHIHPITLELTEHAMAPLLLDDCDSRVMDITVVKRDCAASRAFVAVAYSDASIRLWRLDIARRRFVCAAHDANRTHSHCVLSLSSFRMPIIKDGSKMDTWWVVSGATNGQLAFWDVTRFVSDTDNSDPQISDLGPPALLQEHVHQSGVNSIDVTSDIHGVTVATGGDDGSVAIWESLDPGTLRLVARRASAHASAVQHVALVGGCRVCSLATDQRLAIWSFTDGLELQHMGCTQVADPAAMAIVNASSHVSVVIVGIGIEIIHLTKRKD
ncbi:WD repeat-containing protein 6 [Coemansia sp. RSA 1646]|nr:WD repeat-containing protein 6 [Coemansia sp. RSA 1646]KAJ2090131.1 WD repeat-containing protein 6 [Coemansia sp. RSA 986]